MAELGFQGFGDTCESTCFSLYDIFNWVVGTAQKKVTSRDTYTLKDDISILHSPGGKSSSASSALQQQCSLQDETSYKEDERDQNSVFGGRSTCSAVSYEGDSGSEVSVTPSSVAISPYRRNSSADAMKVLRGYYDAFNDHDITAAVGYLAYDIQVTFPDPKKNWSTSATAYDRYTTMFRKSPHLKGKFSLLDVVHHRERTTITVYCHFTCSPSGVNTVREMVYVVENDLIQAINNKY